MCSHLPFTPSVHIFHSHLLFTPSIHTFSSHPKALRDKFIADGAADEPPTGADTKSSPPAARPESPDVTQRHSHLPFTLRLTASVCSHFCIHAWACREQVMPLSPSKPHTAVSFSALEAEKEARDVTRGDTHLLSCIHAALVSQRCIVGGWCNRRGLSSSQARVVAEGELAEQKAKRDESIEAETARRRETHTTLPA